MVFLCDRGRAGRGIVTEEFLTKGQYSFADNAVGQEWCGQQEGIYGWPGTYMRGVTDWASRLVLTGGVVVNHDLHQEQDDAACDPQRQRSGYKASRIPRLAHLFPNPLQI